MTDYYRKLLSIETMYLSDRIAKYNKILDEDDVDSNRPEQQPKIPETGKSWTLFTLFNLS